MCAAYLSSSSWPSGGATAVAIGNFDGVHAGHRAVLEALLAGPEVGRRLAYTFDPAPTAVLAPERHQPRILPLDVRVQRLHDAGVDDVIVEPFNLAYAARPAAWFAEEVLQRRLAARRVVVGYDFRFGAGRAGDGETLRGLLPEVEVIVVEAASLEGAAVSSSRIRRLVAAGEVEAAARLLGCPHELRGLVVHGEARGRTLGFPTANLAGDVELQPPDGVYAVRVLGGPLVRDGSDAGWPGVMNLGHRPTVGGVERRLEVHLLGWSGDLYGENLRVQLVCRLRAERRFESLEALKAQIGADAEAARRALA